MESHAANKMETMLTTNGSFVPGATFEQPHASTSASSAISTGEGRLAMAPSPTPSHQSMTSPRSLTATPTLAAQQSGMASSRSSDDIKREMQSYMSVMKNTVGGESLSYFVFTPRNFFDIAKFTILV